MQPRGVMHAPPPLMKSPRPMSPQVENIANSTTENKFEMSTATEVAGEAKKKSTAIAEVVTPLVQGFDPVNKIHQHLCAFHLYSEEMGRLPVEAQHYCAHQNEEVRQCLVYDSSGADSRLIGVEYIVSEMLFLTLPDTEKPLWHSHEYEVKSGVLFLPGIPSPLQKPDLEKVCKTYGKVFHFWQVDRGDHLPLGLPLIMMALTKDNQLPPTLLHDVEKKYGVSLAEEREAREYMSGPQYGIHPLANGNGMGLRLEINERELDVPTKL